MAMITPDPCLVLIGHLQQRGAVDVAMADGVEGDVDAAGPGGDGVGVLVHGPLVQGVDPGRLDRSPRAGDLGGHQVERGQGAAGQEDPRPLAGEGAGHGRPDRPGPPVDHGRLVLQQHLRPPRGGCWIETGSIESCR
jgi:hypothetical protein